MEFTTSELNGPEILIATFAYSAFSGIRHRQFAFGKKWEAAMGLKRPEGWKETQIYYIVPLIGCFLASLTVGMLHSWTEISNLREALIIGLAVGIGVGTTVTFTHAVIPTMH